MEKLITNCNNRSLHFNLTDDALRVITLERLKAVSPGLFTKIFSQQDVTLEVDELGTLTAFLQKEMDKNLDGMEKNNLNRPMSTKVMGRAVNFNLAYEEDKLLLFLNDLYELIIENIKKAQPITLYDMTCDNSDVKLLRMIQAANAASWEKMIEVNPTRETAELIKSRIVNLKDRHFVEENDGMYLLSFKGSRAVS